MYITNNTGPKTEPFGIPHLIGSVYTLIICFIHCI